MAKTVVSKEFTVKLINVSQHPKGQNYKLFHFWDIMDLKKKFNLTWKQVRVWKKFGIVTVDKWYF